MPIKQASQEVPQTPAVPVSKLTDFFMESFIELIKSNPNNPVVRAHIMRVCKIQPPAELKTFAELEQWICSQPPPRRTPVPIRKNYIGREPAPSINLQAKFTRKVSGRAFFSGYETARENLNITLQDVLGVLEEDPDASWADIMCRIIDSEIDNGDLAWNDEDGWDYQDHDTDNIEDEGGSFENRTDALRHIKHFVAEQSMETYESINENE